MSKKVKEVLNVLGYDVKSAKGSYTLYAVRINNKGQTVNKTLGYYPNVESLLNGLLEYKITNADLIHNVEKIIQLKQEIIDIITGIKEKDT